MKKSKLLELNTVELYNFILFALYKLRDNPDYLVLSEMMLLLDKDTVLTLMEYFGGLTITIPKISDLQTVIKTLNIYVGTKFHGKNFIDMIQGIPKKERKKVRDCYDKLEHIMELYKVNE